MNKNTVTKAVLACSQIFDELGVSPAERCAAIANLLIVGSLDANGKIVRHPDVLPTDAFAVERALLESGSRVRRRLKLSTILHPRQVKSG